MSDREEQLRTLIAQFPDSPLPWFSLGQLYTSVQRFAEAAEAYERCLGFDPDYAAALMALGEVRVALGEEDRARAALERCVRVALAQGHPTLAGEARERLAELASEG